MATFSDLLTQLLGKYNPFPSSTGKGFIYEAFKEVGTETNEHIIQPAVQPIIKPIQNAYDNAKIAAVLIGGFWVYQTFFNNKRR